MSNCKNTFKNPETRYKFMQDRGLKCGLCGYSKHPRILCIHHKIPCALGGTHNPLNLIVLCPNCHALEHINLEGVLTRNNVVVRKK